MGLVDVYIVSLMGVTLDLCLLFVVFASELARSCNTRTILYFTLLSLLNTLP